MNDSVSKMIDYLANDDFDRLISQNKIYRQNHNSKFFMNKLEDFLKENNTTDTKVVVHRNFNGINGLFYIEDYLSKKEIDAIKNKIDTEVDLEPLSKSRYSRRVAHYGYYYSYDRSGLKPAPEILKEFAELVSEQRINSILNENLLSKEFEQLIINEYKPGQQIAYHTDHIGQFGPVIACLTVSSSVPIKFRLDSEIKKLNIAEGSLYIMTGDVRYKWKHSLINKSNATRYSLTFRTKNS